MTSLASYVTRFEPSLPPFWQMEVVANIKTNLNADRASEDWTVMHPRGSEMDMV